MKIAAGYKVIFLVILCAFWYIQKQVKASVLKPETEKVYTAIIFDLFDVLVGKIGKKGTERRIEPFPKAIELFFQLKRQGYKLYLLSNIARSRFEAIMQKAHDPGQSEWLFFTAFDGYMTSFKAGMAKPHEHIFQRLLDDFFLLPEECFFIDDKQINIDTAKRLGINGIVCKDHDHDQLKEALKQLNILTDGVD